MFATFKSGYPDQNDSNDGELLRDIEEISKALYFENRTQVSSLVSYSSFGPKKSHFADFKRKTKHGFDKDNERKEEQKNSSIWVWKPFKALSHIRQRKFNCCFFCHVHCVENLMLDFNDVSICVVWRRKDTVLKTLPARVSNGMVEFEETLMSNCTVYGSRSGSGDFVKYEPKHFLLYASVVGDERAEIGKHWVDLTRLLPLTFDGLEQDKCSGKWSTSFKFVGKAKGATLHVSFGFLVTKDGLVDSGSNWKPPLLQSGLSRMSFAESSSVRNNTALRQVGSVPSSLVDDSCISAECLDAKDGLRKDSFEFSNSLSMLYGKLGEASVDSPTKIDLAFEHLESLCLVTNPLSGSGEDSGAEHGEAEFTVVEKGIESNSFQKEEKKLNDTIAENLEVSSIEVIDIAEIFKDEGICSDEEIKIDRLETFGCEENSIPVDKYSVTDTKEANLEEQDLNLHKMFIKQSDELGMSEDEMSTEIKVKHKGSNLVKSLSLDDISEVVEDDFCSMLEDIRTPSPRNSNTDLESPRERLLRQFEEDMITSSIFLDVDVRDYVSEDEYEAPSFSSPDYNIESVNLSPIIDISEYAANESVQESLRRKLKAKSLECLETQTLLQRWGLHEEDFLDSPSFCSGGFGSPIFISPEEPVGLPPLAEGLEPLLHLKDGGCLRSMSPLLFLNAKNCGPLIIQTSKTLVLPVELGSNIMDILQCLASIGSYRLSKKVHNLMPLEDISGKIMQQLAWEASCDAEVLERPAHFESNIKIEVEHPYFQDYNYLSSSSTVNDLRSAYVAAKDLALLALDSIEALIIEGLKIQSGMPDQDAPSTIRVTSASEVGPTKHRVDYSDDSSDFLGAKGTDEYINRLLDLSISLDEWLRLDSGMSGVNNEEVTETTLKVLRAHHAKRQEELENCGVFGDNLTLALIMQLRDPLRNYEPVGGPMLGLIQVKRLIEPLTPVLEDNKIRESTSFRFRLEEVHVGGLNLDSDHNLETWSSRRQQQAGSRWLVASGLTKSTKPRFSKSRSIMKVSAQVARKTWSRSFIWSISRPIHGVVADPLTRNPDFIFPQVSV